MSYELNAKSILGFEIPSATQIEGKPMKAVRTDNLIFTSGQLSIANGKDIKGQVGKDLTVEEGYEAAKWAGINCLSAIKTQVDSLDKIVRVVKLLGMVNVAHDFNENPDNNTSQVINGCSDLIHQIFGDAGRHARSAVGMVLPRNYAVEIEMIVEVK